MTQLNIIKRIFTPDKTLMGKIIVFMIEIFNYKIPLTLYPRSYMHLQTSCDEVNQKISPCNICSIHIFVLFTRVNNYLLGDTNN
jgi:hypothetical protein